MLLSANNNITVFQYGLIKTASTHNFKVEYYTKNFIQWIVRVLFLKHASVFKEGQILYIILYHFLYFYDKVENWVLVVSNTL